jgi:hypothetical protein
MPKPPTTEDPSFLRAEYQVAIDIIKLLTDIRFRCLVFVTAITAVASALVSSTADAGMKPAVGILGLLATLGIAIYELRNSQLYELAMDRAKALEQALDAPRTRKLRQEAADPGGIFSERLAYIPAAEKDETSQDTMRFWFFGVQHDRGLALVYSSAMGAWLYLALYGLISLDAPAGAWWGISLGSIRLIAGAFAIFTFTTSYMQFMAHDTMRRKTPRLRVGKSPVHDTPFLWCWVRPHKKCWPNPPQAGVKSGSAHEAGEGSVAPKT